MMGATGLDLRMSVDKTGQRRSNYLPPPPKPGPRSRHDFYSRVGSPCIFQRHLDITKISDLGHRPVRGPK